MCSGGSPGRAHALLLGGPPKRRNQSTGSQFGRPRVVQQEERGRRVLEAIQYYPLVADPTPNAEFEPRAVSFAIVGGTVTDRSIDGRTMRPTRSDLERSSR